MVDGCHGVDPDSMVLKKKGGGEGADHEKPEVLGA